MRSEVRALDANRACSPDIKVPCYEDASRRLAAFQAHLNKTGKVCPRPWCWRRFCNLFKPGYEPPWLSNWWEVSIQEKRELFQQQLEYLALKTDRFQAAYQFLDGLQEEHWYFGA